MRSRGRHVSENTVTLGDARGNERIGRKLLKEKDVYRLSGDRCFSLAGEHPQTGIMARESE